MSVCMPLIGNCKALYTGSIPVAVSSKSGGYDPADWQDVKHAVATLTGVVTHEDPMALTGTVVYTPQEPRADLK